ncbi:4,5:9,10-diseco-3-hydroxy-5,9, 17-trioxoandrosta-1(10),2-diene-4-oate hydrolase [Aquimixticola soesokkakensis]|uniref:4,5:9,10-diseco-3-hydroxy-5,9, 17-trioxoandrosta-1(10),2-diene-4-oate hydrolase n=1 Tax=Aquimixticola soesokkakensis TaxID=1519096 RepID=A0A1Y5SJY1_9RHOB|nr:alpha/beta hydrolase [Aquimixticola soesokkakensis]SLN42417.1 4,5:9,10-diseco-3-hydroxy-5,9, 17-trioxoandrosta-1(10),2-diene-4-oate hydrolase [Aquimixticola soesokkakensis]
MILPKLATSPSVVILILIALFSAVSVARAMVRERAVERANPPLGRFVMVDDHPVHLWEAGDPNAPSVVLIHGASGSVRDFTGDLGPQLASRYHVVALDRPGFGYTPALADMDDNRSLSRQAALLRGALAQIGVTRPVLLGQSYGGSVVLRWAEDAPDSIRALVPVSAPSHLWPDPPSLFYRALATPVVGPILATLITAWVPRSYIAAQVESVFAPQTAPSGYGDYFHPFMSARRETLLVNARQRIALRDEVSALLAGYPNMALPVEAVHGEADPIVPFDIHAVPLARDVPDLHLTALPGIGHMPHHVAIPAVIAAVDRAAGATLP